ncbi:MAG: PKD domain-containing protein [Bacteroidetes bacterium]|nr:PKD domain-containing protein [Bacteroidota bacterium]
MKKLLLSFALITICLLPSYFLQAQEVHPVSGEPLKYCGATEAMQELYKNNPYLKNVQDIIDLQDEENSKTNPVPHGVVYTIPVVVHVLHNYGPENISDAQVKDAVNILLRDFRKQNADTATVATPFKALIADCEVEFKLAQLDPNGICTNGIDRIATQLTYNASDASKLNQWPRNKYLNIWTCSSIASGAAGYSYYPSATVSNPAIDGVMILHSYVGSIGTSSATTSRALTHEVGHWANLQHCWGSTNQPGVACGDDVVTDTPVTMGWTSCNLSSNDVCTPGTDENVENYMEYAYCQKMYTSGQKTRVRNALFSSTASRNNLWSAGNLTATGLSGSAQLCTADFSVNKKVVCVGTSITFTDLSWNNPPTSWQWDFDNNTTIDATTQNPTYIYNTPGTYSVTLTVSDGISTKTTTKASYIIVLGNTATGIAPYSEGLENAGFPYNDWYNNLVSGSTSPTWNRTTSAAYTGSASLTLNNYSSTLPYVEETMGPSVDLSQITSPTLNFRVAYAQKTSSDADKLRMLVSTTCGAAWSQKYSKFGANLATAGVVSSSFTPTISSQWRLESVSLASYSGSNNFRFKFEFTGAGGAGNNVYIDDINITGTPLGIAEETANEFGFSVFPNPLNENTTVSFSIANKHTVSIGIYDVIGKEITPVSTTELGAGTYEFPISGKTLNAGVYFVKLNVDGYSVMKKVIVE